MYSQHNINTNSKNPDVVAFARGDVNGDKIPDNVYLTGQKQTDSSRVQNIVLVIQDGRSGAFYSVSLKNNEGYDPRLFLGDFTGDGVSDILISIATGGSGGTYYYYIYSFVSNSARLLFDSDAYNQYYNYDVNFMDNYKVEVESMANRQKYLIDLTLRDPEYLNEIYDANGRLKEPISGWVDPISGLNPIDFDSNGVYELLAIQMIAGKYHADSLGFVQNTLKWSNNMFVLYRQEVAIFGA